MRKYTSVLFAFVLFITLLGFNANSASATNCAPGDLFSSATGQPCSGTKMEVNGGADSSEDGDVLKFNDLLKNGFAIGSKGDDVRMLQQFLRDLGYYLGKIDGNYGKRTARAVKDFQDDNN
ncbi:MAG: Peptidoglycan-binding domain 1 protein [Candidatus Nomurabacteria bacterium GW2011_GWA1_40_8]|nr:MAG: Peptidoglycan-binding domain 1 protein [Candidatus Nomurabacteria bacterium GW2011_GWA1_40_8]